MGISSFRAVIFVTVSKEIQLSWFFRFSLIFYVRGSAQIRVCAPFVCLVTKEARRGVRAHGTRVTDSREPSCGCQELNPGSISKCLNFLPSYELSCHNIAYYFSFSLMELCPWAICSHDGFLLPTWACCRATQAGPFAMEIRSFSGSQPGSFQHGSSCLTLHCSLLKFLMRLKYFWMVFDFNLLPLH